MHFRLITKLSVKSNEIGGSKLLNCQLGRALNTPAKFTSALAELF